jgi:membrane-anchored mycosin MYCP
VPARRWERRLWVGAALALAAVVTVVMMAAGVGRAGVVGRAGAVVRRAAGLGYVKYYVVAASYRGQPENLSEIAARFLGSDARSGQIFALNTGVPQAVGGALTDPAVLRPGWVLVLPWDAVGAGVRYGMVPTAAPAPPPPPAQTAAPRRVKPHHSQAGGCAGTPGGTGGSAGDWAMLRVAPQHAWRYSNGAGVMVAIVDSGVDATVPTLAGRVAVGDDVIGGSGRGNTDCLGSGTAMAGIVAARPDASGGSAGVAPAARILPVRVAPTKAAVPVADQASAIEIAVSAGARVIALGQFIDPSKPAVAGAIEAAASRGVVVVAPAQMGAGGAGADGAAATDGVIWVGSINIDGAMAADYPSGAVDVVAPGVGVTSVGITGTGWFEGTGPQYAVAFVAGEAALVRARYPDLTAAQVARRIEATADQMGRAAPDARFGWGLIDPGAAVTRVIADEGRGPGSAVRAAGPAHGWSSLRIKALVITVLLALLLVLLLILRVRRMMRPAAYAGAAATAASAPGAAAGVPPDRAPPGTPALTDEPAATGSTPIADTTAKLVGAKLFGAKLFGAKLVGAKSTGAKSTGAEPVGAEPVGAKSTGAELAGAKFTGAELAGAKSTGAELAGAKSTGAEPAGAKSTGAEPAGAKSTGAKPAGAKSAGAEPAGAEPAGAKSTGAEPVGARPAGARPPGRGMAGAGLARPATAVSAWATGAGMSDQSRDPVSPARTGHDPAGT